MSKLKAKPPQEIVARQPVILVFGEPGVGKTLGALGWPSPYMIDTEQGATGPQYVAALERSHGSYLGPPDALDFDVVLQQIDALATEQHDYKTLIFDSYSKLFQTEVAKEWDRLYRRGQNMSSTYGCEKKPAIAQTRRLISQLDRLQMTTLLVCHEVPTWADGKPSGVTADVWDKIFYETDLTLQIVANGSQRVAKVGKSRLSQFTRGAAFPFSYSEFAKRLADSSNGG